MAPELAHEIPASCTPSTKLSTKNLCCFYRATATESDVTLSMTIVSYLMFKICSFPVVEKIDIYPDV